MEFPYEPLRFRITTAELAGGACVVTIAGELDLENARRIDEELDEIAATGARHVVIDLLEVPFLESTVLGVLLAHVRRLRAAGGEMTIVTDDVRVLRVFDITGLRSRFRFEPSLSDALEGVLFPALQ